jgi:hypothetical protein
LASVVSVTVSTPVAIVFGVKSAMAQAVPVKPVSAVTVGVPVNVVGNPTLIVPPFATAPVADGVNPTVHVALAPWTRVLELNVTDVKAAALAIVAVPSSTMAKMTAAAVSLFTRLMGLKPDESSCPTTE